METYEQQELRGRRILHTKAIVKASMLAGLFVFIIPSGGPWMSQEAFSAAMGRIISDQWIVDVVAHFLLAFVYGWIIGPIIYRPPLAAGIALGPVIGLGLYAVNFGTIGMALGKPGYELHVGIEHLVFALIFSVAYRAMAIPDGIKKPEGRSIEGHSRGKSFQTPAEEIGSC